MNSRYFLALGALLTVAMPAQLLAQRVKLEDMVLEVQAGVPVEVVVNDQPLRVMIAPDAVSAVTVNADAAERLGLRPSMFGFIYVIGPTEIPFRTDTVRYHMAGDSFRRRTAFGERQIVENADATVGPGHFPQERVVMRLRDETPQDRPIALPLERMGRSLTGTLLEVGGVPIHVAFSFDRGETLVSATGGRAIADDRGGYFDGDTRSIPVLYLVERPVRALTLRDPLMLGPLAIRNIAVRTADHGSASGIDEGPPEGGDANEIVVTANSGDIPAQRMYVGMDTIGHCASITYDFDAETLTLMCPEQPASDATETGSDQPEPL